jgi:macrodomain Ter protein organizer (MatP/YcbG family)
MPGLEEGPKVFRYRIADPKRFSKFRVKELGKGVKITLGKVKGSDRWEIQNYMFEKKIFKTPEQVRKWLDEHLKAQIRTLLDFRAWNEYRRRLVNAYVQISNVE